MTIKTINKKITEELKTLNTTLSILMNITENNLKDMRNLVDEIKKRLEVR